MSRWLRLTLLANGIRDDLSLSDAIGVAGMLVATGRSVHPSKWVGSMIAGENNSRLESLI